MSTIKPSTASTCPECDIGPFTRNHYFTGKLLVERDFKDEQRYYIDKLRHHQQRLHGWGVVCGLTVVPHDKCPDRYVCIKPGTAIDCCGHEIVVPEQHCIDLMQFEAVQELIRQAQDNDQATHRLQICLSYRECGTENIPVLYDECGCDDTQCAPNRILESYAVEVRIDPETTPQRDFVDVNLDWVHTLCVAQPHRVVLNPNTDRVYVLTDAVPPTLMVLSTENHSVLGAIPIGGTVTDLAVDIDRNRVYVAGNVGGANPFQVRVYDGDLASLVQQTVPDSSAAGTVRLAVAPNGRLYALNTENAQVYAWDTPHLEDLPDGSVGVGTAPTDIVAGPKNQRVFVANSGSANISVIKATDLTDLTEKKVSTGAGTKPFALAVADTVDGTRLFIADQDNRRVHLFDVQQPGIEPPLASQTSVALSDAPLGLVASPEGRWVYVLARADDDSGWVVPIDANKVRQSKPGAVGPALSVGVDPRSLAGTRATLYAAYHGQADKEEAGGVAVIEVTEELCEKIFERALDDCPSCDEDNCVVLATIEKYTPKQILTAEDIDNLVDRRMLPSTSLITEVVQCLLRRGAGLPGEQGPPGLDGLGIDSVNVVETLPPGSDASATLVTQADGTRVLELRLPRGADGTNGTNGTNGTRGDDGDDGDDGLGLNPDLPKILDISWVHDSEHTYRDFRDTSIYNNEPGEVRDRDEPPLLTVYFNEEMRGLDRETFQVSVKTPEIRRKRGDNAPSRFELTGLVERQEIYGHLVRLGGGGGPARTPHTNEPYADSWSFVPDKNLWQSALVLFGSLVILFQLGMFGQNPLLRPVVEVLLKGDFISMADSFFTENSILDGDNIRGLVGFDLMRGGDVQGGNNPSGNLTQGGDFESWFRMDSVGVSDSLFGGLIGDLTDRGVVFLTPNIASSGVVMVTDDGLQFVDFKDFTGQDGQFSNATRVFVADTSLDFQNVRRFDKVIVPGRGIGTFIPFATRADGGAGLVNINTASRSELIAVTGIGDATARTILSERKVRAFTDSTDFRERVGVTIRNWNFMRSEITLNP